MPESGLPAVLHFEAEVASVFLTDRPERSVSRRTFADDFCQPLSRREGEQFGGVVVTEVVAKQIHDVGNLFFHIVVFSLFGKRFRLFLQDKSVVGEQVGLCPQPEKFGV